MSFEIRTGVYPWIIISNFLLLFKTKLVRYPLRRNKNNHLNLLPKFYDSYLNAYVAG